MKNFHEIEKPCLGSELIPKYRERFHQEYHAVEPQFFWPIPKIDEKIGDSSLKILRFSLNNITY